MNNWTEGIHHEGGLTIERLAIRTPIWHSKKVGIAQFRAMRSHIVEVKVLYRLKKDDKRKQWIPKILSMRSAKILGYERQNINGTELCLVPIADFQEKTT